MGRYTPPTYSESAPSGAVELGHMRQAAGVLRLVKEEGRTVLVITHDTELIREAADHAVKIKGY